MMRCYTYKILELSELINKFSEVAGYKINIQKSVMHKRKFRMYQRPKCKARHFKKKNKIMLFAATWMDLEIIILSEIRERQISDTHVESKEMIQMNSFTKQK